MARRPACLKPSISFCRSFRLKTSSTKVFSSAASLAACRCPASCTSRSSPALARRASSRAFLATDSFAAAASVSASACRLAASPWALASALAASSAAAASLSAADVTSNASFLAAAFSAAA